MESYCARVHKKIKKQTPTCVFEEIHPAFVVRPESATPKEEKYVPKNAEISLQELIWGFRQKMR